MNNADRILVREIRNAPEPHRIYEAFKQSPFSFFLDSGMDPGKLGRYSFIGGEPFLVMKSRGRDVTLRSAEGAEVISGSPFDVLCGILERYRLENPTGLPFMGGAVGYLSYDLGHFVERLPSNAVDDLQLPECCFGFYDSVVIFDHLEAKTFAVAVDLPGLSPTAGDRLRRVCELVEGA